MHLQKCCHKERTKNHEMQLWWTACEPQKQSRCSRSSKEQLWCIAICKEWLQWTGNSIERVLQFLKNNRKDLASCKHDCNDSTRRKSDCDDTATRKIDCNDTLTWASNCDDLTGCKSNYDNNANCVSNHKDHESCKATVMLCCKMKQIKVQLQWKLLKFLKVWLQQCRLKALKVLLQWLWQCCSIAFKVDRNNIAQTLQVWLWQCCSIIFKVHQWQCCLDVCESIAMMLLDHLQSLPVTMLLKLLANWCNNVVQEHSPDSIAMMLHKQYFVVDCTQAMLCANGCYSQQKLDIQPLKFASRSWKQGLPCRGLSASTTLPQVNTFVTFWSRARKFLLTDDYHQWVQKV